MRSRRLFWLGLAGLTAACNNLLDNSLHGTATDAGNDATIAGGGGDAGDAGSAAADGAVRSDGSYPADAPTGDGSAKADGGPRDGASDAAQDASEGGPACAVTCDGGCVTLDTDVHNCGTCGHDCTLLPGVSAIGLACTAGRCTYECVPGALDCDATGTGCNESASSATSCGACGVTCAGQTSCAQVDAGVYGCTSTCPSGTMVCSQTCANVRTDPRNCGQCNDVCTAPTLGQGICDAGHCGQICTGSLSLCNGACVDESSDNANCGACGRTCGAGLHCVAGSCACDTTSGCSGCCSDPATCVPVASETTSCGTGGNACNACSVTGQSCAAGACACPGGESACNGACVDTTSSSANCGRCGRSCTVGTSSPACSGGMCGAVLVAAVGRVKDMASDGASLYFIDAATSSLGQVSADNASGTITTLTPSGGLPGLTNLSVTPTTAKNPSFVAFTQATGGNAVLWVASGGSAASAKNFGTIAAGTPYGLTLDFPAVNADAASIAVENPAGTAFSVYLCNTMGLPSCQVYGSAVMSSARPGKWLATTTQELAPLWTDAANGVVYAWTPAGSTNILTEVVGQTGADDIATDAPWVTGSNGYLYWVNGALTLARAPVTPAASAVPVAAQSLASVGTVFPANIATDGTNVYWIGSIGGVSGVYYVPVAGGTPARLAPHAAATGIVLVALDSVAGQKVIYESDDGATTPGIYKLAPP